MTFLPEVLLCGGLLWVFGHDVKERSIHVVMLPVLAGLILWIGLGQMSVEVLVVYGLVNLAFVAFLLLSVILYLRVKLGEWVNPFNGFFGLGDALFWGVLCLAFSPLNFIFFQVLSLMASLVLHVLLSFFKGYGDRGKVPLAGLQALFLTVVYLAAGDFFYNDHMILSFLLS